MVLRELRLKNYKNLSCGFEFVDGINILIYPNGWGKTNLLEAIDYLSSLKSFRGLGDGALRNWEVEMDFASLKAKIRTPKQQELEVILSDDKKSVKLNGAPTSSKKFKTHLATFLYSPHNADIVSSAPDIRRTQFDRFISEFDENYDKLLKEYKYVLKNRNKLLSRINEGREGDMQLDYWDDRFVELGESILSARLKLLSELEEFIHKASNELYKDGLDLDINYSSKVVEDQVLALREKITENRLKEINAGLTLYGPHRDDYEFLLNGNLLRSAGSRGQQRVAGIILLLALNMLFEEKFEKKAILLFDDIFSELDDEHRANIEKVIGKLENQIFVTSSQKELFTDGFLEKTFQVNVL